MAEVAIDEIIGEVRWTSRRCKLAMLCSQAERHRDENNFLSAKT